MATKRELISEGVKWIEAQREELLELYTQALINLRTTGYYRKLPPDFLHRVVAANLDGLRNRLLVGGSFDHEGVKAGLVASIKRGVSLPDLIWAVEAIEEVFLTQAQQDLFPTQPQVYTALAERVKYIGTLMKATMAAAAIEANTVEDPAAKARSTNADHNDS